jgi:glyoxylase-like metal-dependent hydrolase (beta-lactamase superfamily II)
MTTTPAGRAQLSVGATTVTYIPDGHGNFSTSFVFPQAGWQDYAAYVDADSRITLSFGSFLIRSGDDVVLVDLGVGAADLELAGIGHMRGGALLRNLAAEGVAPADIGTVVYTHLHSDHVGWTSDATPDPFLTQERTGFPVLTFPNARYRVARKEWSYWSSGNEVFGGPDPYAVLKPLADSIDFVADGDAIAPGVTVRAMPGHTPGHLAIVIADPTAAHAGMIVIAGDCLHSPVQLAARDLRFASDVDPGQAEITRAALLSDASAVIAAGHFPGHVFGRADRSGGHLSWVPVHKL